MGYIDLHETRSHPDGIVGNRAVLQRGTDTAAVVFGRVAGCVTASASVGVTVTEVGVGSYTVAARCHGGHARPGRRQPDVACGAQAPTRPTAAASP